MPENQGDLYQKVLPAVFRDHLQDGPSLPQVDMDSTGAGIPPHLCLVLSNPTLAAHRLHHGVPPPQDLAQSPHSPCARWGRPGAWASLACWRGSGGPLQGLSTMRTCSCSRWVAESTRSLRGPHILRLQLTTSFLCHRKCLYRNGTTEKSSI